MRVNVQLKQVLSHQLVNLSLVLFDLILQVDTLRVAISVELAPDLLNLCDPHLVCRVGRLV